MAARLRGGSHKRIRRRRWRRLSLISEQRYYRTMWRANVVVVLILTTSGCRTEYQRGMGFKGGTAVAPLGDDTFVVTARVNGYTSQGEAVEYAYRRASETCSAGFQVVDRHGDSKSSYLAFGNGVTQIKKHEVTLVVKCNPSSIAMTSSSLPATARASPDEEHRGDTTAVPTNTTVGARMADASQPVPFARWWCVTFLDRRLGVCHHEREWCERSRASAIATDASTSYCEPQTIAVCFGVAFPSGSGSDEMCAPTPASCTAQRDFAASHPEQARVLTPCRAVD